MVLGGILAISFIGIVLIPFWLLGIGVMVARRYYAHLECVLTERTLEYKKGAFIRTEKTVLLDKIQDLTLKEGSVLQALGLTTLLVETAGQSSAQGSGDARLIGIVDAREFRKKVLAQRDLLLNETEVMATAAGGEQDSDTQVPILREMSDTLKRIEERLGKSGTS